jgi:O-antigen/teichoic acid export membrane protein
LKNELALIILGRFIVAFTGLVSLRIMTHFMQPEKYGELSLLIVIQSMCGLILVNPVGQYLNVNTHKWYDQGSLFSRIRSYRIYLFSVSLISAGLVILLFSEKIEDLLFSTLSLFLIVWSINWNSTLVPLLNMLGARVKYLIWSVLTVVLGVSGSIFFIIYFSPTPSNWLFGQAIGMIIGILGAKYSLKNFVLHEKKEKKGLITKKVFISFCLPLSIATLFMWFTQSGYRLLIEHYWGVTTLAFFVVGFQVAGALWAIIENIAMQFLHPYYFRASSDVDDEIKLQTALSDFVNVLIPLYIFLSGVMLLGAKQIFYLLVDEKYYAAINFFYAAVIVELARASAYILTHAVHVKRKTIMLILPYCLYATSLLISVVVSGYFKINIEYFAYIVPFIAIFFILFMNFCMNKIIHYSVFWRMIYFSVVFLFTVIVYIYFFEIDLILTLTSSFLYLLFLGGVTLVLIYLYLTKSSALKRLVAENIV